MTIRSSPIKTLHTKLDALAVRVKELERLAKRPGLSLPGFTLIGASLRGQPTTTEAGPDFLPVCPTCGRPR